MSLRIVRSLRFRIFASISIAGLLPCLLLSVVIVESYESRAVSVRTSQIQNQCMVLANHLYLNGYLDDISQPVITAELMQLSELYDGRVMIIDRDFKIIQDTYSISIGKTMISPEVLRCFEKSNTAIYDSNNHYIEVTTPIIGKNGEEVTGVMLTSVSTDNISDTITLMKNRAALIATAAGIIIIAIAFWFSYLLVRPINQITVAISKIDEGFRQEKISVMNYRETRRITQAFNDMLGRMKVLDDSRQEFVANVSHELKTPMTSMKVLADSLVQMEDVPNEMYKEFMEDIVSEIDRENKIINDLLSLVKMDKDSGKMDIATVNLGTLLEGIMKRLTPIAEKNKVDLLYECIRNCDAEIDETKLSLAFTNLIENGIKYNNENGYVKVSLDAEPQFALITIEDNGIGIPQEDLPNIFERFFRVDKSHSREIGGTGLGLAITRNAIVMHNGAIKVESEPGRGTTFVVKIPLSYIQEGGAAV